MLTDIRMPKMNGIELAKTVSKKYPKIETILMSAYDLEDIEGGQNENIEWPKLSKPFNISELVFLLNENNNINNLNIREQSFVTA